MAMFIYKFGFFGDFTDMNTTYIVDLVLYSKYSLKKFFEHKETCTLLFKTKESELKRAMYGFQVWCRSLFSTPLAPTSIVS